MDSLTSVFWYHLLNKLPELRSLTRTLLNQNLHTGFHVFLENTLYKTVKRHPADACITSSMSSEEGALKVLGWVQ